MVCETRDKRNLEFLLIYRPPDEDFLEELMDLLPRIVPESLRFIILCDCILHLDNTKYIITSEFLSCMESREFIQCLAHARFDLHPRSRHYGCHNLPTVLVRPLPHLSKDHSLPSISIGKRKKNPVYLQKTLEYFGDELIK